jgi:hypothetical protein
MRSAELRQLAEELRGVPTWQEAIKVIVRAICASREARRAEEDKKYHGLGVPARVDVNIWPGGC